MDSPMDTGSVDSAEERRQFVTPRRLSQLLLQPPSFFSAAGGCATTGTNRHNNTSLEDTRNQHSPLVSAGRSTDGADGNLAELLQSRAAMLENEKRQLLEQVVTLKHSLSTATHEHDIHCREMQSKYEAALMHIQDCGQIELQQANRCSQELAIQLQSVCNEREEAEKCWLARESQLKERCESRVSEVVERLKLCEDERAVLRDRIDEVSLELKEREEQLSDDLQTKTTEMSALQESLKQSKHRLRQFQQYIGATDLPSDSKGLNVHQEKTALQQKVQELQRENQLLCTEAELVRVRVDSLSQILSIQEAELSKHCSQEVVVPGKPLGPSQLHTLLSRWRTKVFELMVKLKNNEIEQHRIQQTCQQQIATAMSDVERVTHEKEVLSLAKKAESAEKLLLRQKLDDCQLTVSQNTAVIHQLQEQLSARSALLARVADKARQIESIPKEMEHFACNVVKSRLLLLETRIGRASGRARALNACLSSQGAVWLSQQTLRNTTDRCVQTDSKEDGEASSQATVVELTRLTHPQLVQECSALESERDRLVRRLNQASQSFHQKLESMKKSHADKLLVLQSRIDRLTQENHSITDQLTSAIQSLHQEREQREVVTSRCSQLEEVVREMETSYEQRLRSALEEESEKAREGFRKMESLLEVARREQAKTAVQLQHLQQQAERDKERAVEAVELSRAQVEHELNVCRKKLHSVQVERNLLMTTLRQEGIKLSNTGQPRSIRSSTVKLRVEEEEGAMAEVLTADKENIEMTASHHREDAALCEKETAASNSHHADEVQAVSVQDMQQVLLDLHQLSSTLLNMDT